MNIPTNLKYSKTHEWVDFTGETAARIGLTDFAQESLGSIVFVNLPGVGDKVSAGKSFGEAESVKTVSEVISPVSGTVTAVNEELLDKPEKINASPYEAWLIQVSGVTEREELLEAGAYEAFCGEQ